MPRNIVYPDPNEATTVGASISIARIAPGAAGVSMAYNPANGDDPLAFTAADFTAAEKTALQTVHQACIRVYRAAKSYT